MSPEKEHELVVKFPDLFVGRTYPLTQSLMAFGCECDDGWFNIIFAMCDAIQRHVREGGWKFEQAYAFVQIKEKFAGLRVYDFGRDDFIDGVISVAETLSYNTCEICGAPGAVCVANGGYWLKTLCPQHKTELEYRLVDNNEML